MEQSIFIVKSYCETESYNPVHTKFRTLFSERLPPNKNNKSKKKWIWNIALIVLPKTCVANHTK